MSTTATTTDAPAIAPIGRKEAPGLAEEEYRRWAAALAALAPEDWERPTDCTGWTVRDLTGHVLGEMRASASIREQVSQQREIGRRVKATGGNMVDVMTATQIDRTRNLTPAEVVAETASLVRPAAQGRRRTPGPLRRLVRIPVAMGPIDETWRLGYLVDTILTRDIFMHRIDLARAVGTRPDMTGAHATRMVAEITGEWARRHAQGFDLTLTGEAGGHFRAGGDTEPALTVDAIEFCRLLSGRGTGEGLLSHQVPF